MTLDTAPHNSGTTLYESLYSGVPFLTLQGHSSLGRLGSSILYHAGLQEFIAKSEDEYVEKAIYFCHNWEPYADKLKIHNKFMASSIVDEASNASYINQVIMREWQKLHGK